MSDKMTLTLKQAHHLLEQCAGVVIDDDGIVYPAVADLEEDGDNCFLSIRHPLADDSEDGQYRFLERQNQEVELVHSSLFLTDRHGVRRQVSLLDAMDAAKYLK